MAALRRGYTLLELILALALATLVMMAIGMAVDLHLRVLDTHRGELEDAQLARAVLRHIASDLRGAIRYEPPDLSGVTEFAGGLTEGAADSLGAGAGAAGSELLPGFDLGLGDLGLGDFGLGGTGTDSSGGLLGISESTTPPAIPGLYGTQTQLQVDVSRLPKPHEYYADPATGMYLPSDVKTVAYYVQNADTMGTAGALFSTSYSALPGQMQAQTGLVRREMDRAVTAYAAENGSTTADFAAGEILAPEVIAIEFAYWDGVQWLTEWDSQINGGLPLAIDVAIAISHDETTTADMTMLDMQTSELGAEMQVFHLVVRLPLGGAASQGGDPTQLEEEATGEEGTTDGASTGETGTGEVTGGGGVVGGGGGGGGATTGGGTTTGAGGGPGGRGGRDGSSGGRGGPGSGGGFGGPGGGFGGRGGPGGGFGGRGRAQGGPGAGGPGGGSGGGFGGGQGGPGARGPGGGGAPRGGFGGGAGGAPGGGFGGRGFGQGGGGQPGGGFGGRGGGR